MAGHPAKTTPAAAGLVARSVARSVRVVCVSLFFRVVGTAGWGRKGGLAVSSDVPDDVLDVCFGSNCRLMLVHQRCLVHPELAPSHVLASVLQGGGDAKASAIAGVHR